MKKMEERLDHLARVMERGFDTLADLQRETNERLDMLTIEVRTLTGRFDNFVTGAHREEHSDLRTRVERTERHLKLA
jgi:hypothetical protein